MRRYVPMAIPWLSMDGAATNTSSFCYLSLIECCSSLKQAQAIHAHLTLLGLICYTYITSRVLALYVHDIACAYQLFARIPQPTIFNWNTMIRGFSNASCPLQGLALYVRMRCHDVAPNMHTFPIVIKSCIGISHLSQVHGQAFKFGFDFDVFITSSLVKMYTSLGAMELAATVFDESSNRNIVCWTGLISGYCSHGLVDKARSIFNLMPDRNSISWSAMITGYVQNKCHEEAIGLFNELRESGVADLNVSLLVSVLNACASSGALEDGQWIHSHIRASKGSTPYGLKLGTAVVDFYMKCGLVEIANEVFDRMPCKDATAWSAMIMGLALNGHCCSAINMFFSMLTQGVMPNEITVIGVLAACNHGGLVEEGRALFRDMFTLHNVRPTIEHYGCMVDLLSRAGRMEEAERLIESMPMEADGAIWGALLSGCLMHGHFKQGERAGKKVMELEPEHCRRYVGLANVYACTSRWASATQVRWAMRERQVSVAPGWSSIVVDGVRHRFLVDDRMHPHQEEICRLLVNLHVELLSSSS